MGMGLPEELADAEEPLKSGDELIGVVLPGGGDAGEPVYGAGPGPPELPALLPSGGGLVGGVPLGGLDPPA